MVIKELDLVHIKLPVLSLRLKHFQKEKVRNPKLTTSRTDKKWWMKSVLSLKSETPSEKI